VRCNTLYRASHIQTGLRVEIPDPDMGETNDVVPIGSLAGMAVLSLSTGNKLGRVSDVRIEPLAGGLTGLSLEGDDNITLPYDRIYSFGRDAVMAVSDDSLIVSAGDSDLPDRRSKDLVGTTVVMESGEVLGEIADILVALKPPPAVVYEIRRSILDRLLGKTFFIPASLGYALSDDAARLVVPDRAVEIASYDISTLLGPAVDVKSFSPVPETSVWEDLEDETVLRDREEDVTVLRHLDVDDANDEDETIVRRPISKNRSQNKQGP